MRDEGRFGQQQLDKTHEAEDAPERDGIMLAASCRPASGWETLRISFLLQTKEKRLLIFSFFFFFFCPLYVARTVDKVLVVQVGGGGHTLSTIYQPFDVQGDRQGWDARRK